MPGPSQLAHRNVRSTNLPFKSNINPTATDPCFVPGSQDLLTSISGYAQRRFGFATAEEPTPTVFHNLQRIFTWNRFDGTFIRMACDINASNQAVVYKRVIGTDASFVSIFTDNSANVFDFVVSNNTVYFSNANVAKAWDPTNGIRNWGIAIGSVNNATGPNTTGNGVDDSIQGQVAWTNPNNVTSSSSYASAVLTAGQNTHNVDCTQFAFSLPSTNTVTGIKVTCTAYGTDTNNGMTIRAQMIKGGNFIGNPEVLPLTQTPGSTVTFGSTSDLWGTTWIPNDINQTTFGVTFFVNDSAAIGTGGTAFLRNVQITVYGLGGPTVSLTGTGLTATTGYQYVFCYGNTNSGHVSSPSPPSAQIKPTNQAIQITLTASTDTQVNQIRVFRSTDSVASGQNAGVYFEIPTSPFANANATPTDSAADTSLNISSVAPIQGFNDPPTPFFSPVYYAGRIWGFKNNQVFYSSLEESTIGVPEESFVSGIAGNFWNFDQPVQALAVAGTGQNQSLVVYCGGAVYAIIGDTLDTFRKVVVSQRRGCMNRACVTSLGGMVAWLDSASQIWASDGNSAQELSVDIRPTIKGLAPTGVSMTFHSAGAFHWLVVAFPTSMLVYDMDLEQWMPPWNVTSSYVSSGQTSPGVYDLLLSNGTKALKLSTTAHNDNGTSYTPIAQTNLFAMVPDYGNRFAYNAMGLYDEPSRTGVPWYVQAETNNTTVLKDVGILTDDDPTITSATYTSIAANQVTPEQAWMRTQGTNLVQNVYGISQPMARWASLKFTLPTTDTSDNLYSFFLAYEVKR